MKTDLEFVICEITAIFKVELAAQQTSAFPWCRTDRYHRANVPP